MTSATERLRRLLDERGVEHYDGCENTLWGYEQTSESTGMYRYSADEIRDGFINVWMHHLTPAQAIDATLGRGTCRDVCAGISEFTCSSCGFSCDLTSWISLFDGDEGRHRHHHHGTPNYCPNCGRKVKED